MRIELDSPLAFDRIRCEICAHEDADWCLMQFLADGHWRKLMLGLSIREQGIDDVSTSRLYVIHSCTEAILRTFVTMEEITFFLKSLKEGPP